jgi:serine/threonine protein kinase
VFGQSEAESLRRWDPEMIGPYVVLGRLGAGSMGQVYLGRSAAGRLVAVKTIKVELAEEAGFRTRFAQEVAAARKVSGFFTPAVVEADPDADLPWLATAYVPAPSLSAMIAACGPLPVRAVNWLAAGCAEALESIHGAGLVHRDLKPSNVLVTPDGPRVIDFGVARAAERMELTVSRGAVGTPAYMAPEQARDPHQASVASDVYSLGATLLFAATGHPPYAGASVMDVLARLATEPPDVSGLPAELADLIMACLERVPRARPTSSAVLAQLGLFTEAQASGGTDPAEEHAYLPVPVMALIGEYQRSPVFATVAHEARGEESTSASLIELPAAYRPRRKPGRARSRQDRARSRQDRGRPRQDRDRPGQQQQADAGSGWRQWVRAHLAWAGWTAVGAALVIGGVILGASLTSTGSTPGTGPPPPPPTACHSSGPVSHGPMLCMVQSAGEPSSTFVVRGSGFPPGTPVTVAITGLGPPPEQANVMQKTATVRPVTGQDGTFSFTVNQLFPSPYPLGLFTVEVTGSHDAQASTQFMVIPASAPPAN